MNDYTIDELIANLPRQRQVPSGGLPPLPIPVYSPNNHRNELALAVKSMQRHVSDEGWQIMAGLKYAGFKLYGYGLPLATTDVREIVEKETPNVVVVQDRREWDPTDNEWRDNNARFKHTNVLADCPSIFRITIIKDAQQRPFFYNQISKQIGAHAWIIYYHPRIVQTLTGFTRLNHLIRTDHSLDGDLIPTLAPKRSKGALISGAISGTYPLRARIARKRKLLPNVDVLVHPGYNMVKCYTPEYLQTLTQYKVSICTCSVYGFALRKIIEATACGCQVLTDLPKDDVLPEIDENLTRIHPRTSFKDIGLTLQRMYRNYDFHKQLDLAERTRQYYDYRTVGTRLANQIRKLRSEYHGHCL